MVGICLLVHPSCGTYHMSYKVLSKVQVWLALRNLLGMPALQARSTGSAARITALLRLRPHLTELLFDQLPVLKEVQFTLDALAITQSSATSKDQPVCLILEQVRSQSARNPDNRLVIKWKQEAMRSCRECAH